MKLKTMNNDKEESKGPFYMVYEVMGDYFGPDVSNVISVMLKHQEYLLRLRRLDLNGYFYMEHKMIKKKTGISEHRQKIAMLVLEELGILKKLSKKKGTPPKTFYKVDGEKYVKYLIGLNKPDEPSE